MEEVCGSGLSLFRVGGVRAGKIADIVDELGNVRYAYAGHFEVRKIDVYVAVFKVDSYNRGVVLFSAVVKTNHYFGASEQDFHEIRRFGAVYLQCARERNLGNEFKSYANAKVRGVYLETESRNKTRKHSVEIIVGILFDFLVYDIALFVEERYLIAVFVEDVFAGVVYLILRLVLNGQVEMTLHTKTYGKTVEELLYRFERTGIVRFGNVGVEVEMSYAHAEVLD